MSQDKPVILLYWSYHRSGWVKVFEELKADFNFIYLCYLSKEHEIASYTDSPKVYWSDFKNINDILVRIKPDKVVFMGMDGPLSILLNAACKKQAIPTFFLQHGIFHPYKAYLEEEQLERKSNLQKPTVVKEIRKLKKLPIRFVLTPVSFLTIKSLLSILQIKVLSKLLKSYQKALYHTKSTSRRTDKYIVYTKYCSRMLAERDGVKDEMFLETGNPEADDVLEQLLAENAPESENDYFLLIDDPLGEVQEWGTDGFISKNSVNAFHTRLNDFALSKGKKLKIKLHPYSYASAFFVEHENITYIREGNVVELIRNAAAIFGILSTLLIPALYSKPCCIFKFNDKYDLHKFLNATKYSPVLDYFKFQIEDISFNYDTTPEQKMEFIKAYLYKEDRQSLLRIKEILQKKY